MCNFVSAYIQILMSDIMTSAQRHYNMSRIHGKDTDIELLVRKRLHASGFRFRLNVRDLPGRPDIVLPKYRTVIFVNGCFWHGHKECRLFVMPKTNTAFWSDKIERNRERDDEKFRQLEALQWNVLVVWECELKKDRIDGTIEQLASNIRENGSRWEKEKTDRRANRKDYRQWRRAVKEKEQAFKAGTRR